MDPATRRRRLRIIFGSFFGLPVLAGVVFFFAPATGFSPEALGYSVSRVAGGDLLLGADGCDRHVRGGWSCWVTPDGSDQVQYRVDMHGARCWDARASSPRFARDTGLPLETAGCLRLRDQIRFFDRLLGDGGD